MRPSAIWAAYFSATGTTEKVISRIAGDLAERFGVPLKTCDFTLPAVRQQPPVFGPDDLVVFGTPVYAGRVPNLLIKFVAAVRGSDTAAVPVVCYGNRAYDNALAELRNTMRAGGFRIAGSAAFSCQHSFSETQAAGRPDVSDLTVAGGFAWRIYEKLAPLASAAELPIGEDEPVGPYYTPRDRHGNPIDIRKVKPLVSDACTKCGKCAKLCPLGSIDPDDITQFTGPCMKCNRCRVVCPVGARYFDDPNYLYHKTELEAQFTFPRREPELFW